MPKTKEEKIEHSRLMVEFDSLFGYDLIAGVDEAGRGPLAGPVFAGAVILPTDCAIEGIDDSKKLSEKKREELFELITEKAIAWAVASVDEKEIDEINIRNATYKAMNMAVNSLKAMPEYVIVDGDAVTNMEIPHMCVIKGDAKSRSIAAASILAKVSRDRYLMELDKQYPEYQFAKHKGYGTKLHTEMILKYGPCPIHRRTFLKKLLDEEKVVNIEAAAK
ncbi:MAG: ribonuclease HII [Bacillota bacterium]|nr:ribonuclease HII [Bacillota bacterium]